MKKCELSWVQALFREKRWDMKSASPWNPAKTNFQPPAICCPARFARCGSYISSKAWPHGSTCGKIPSPWHHRFQLQAAGQNLNFMDDTRLPMFPTRFEGNTSSMLSLGLWYPLQLLMLKCSSEQIEGLSYPVLNGIHPFVVTWTWPQSSGCGDCQRRRHIFCMALLCEDRNHHRFPLRTHSDSNTVPSPEHQGQISNDT